MLERVAPSPLQSLARLRTCALNMPYPYRHRTQAGQVLARALSHLAGRPGVLVLALPPNGVPVAYEVAHALSAPLDLLAVQPLLHTLGSPPYEVTLGLLGPPAAPQLHEPTLNVLQLSEQALHRVTARARRALHRRLLTLRPPAPPPELAGRTVVLVDEGAAAGLALLRAAGLVRRAGASAVVAAVPVSAPEGLRLLASGCDEVICPHAPEPFVSVAAAYGDSRPVEDDEVYALLCHAWGQAASLPTTSAASRCAPAPMPLCMRP
jgi:putative phosphoribosyl transferase